MSSFKQEKDLGIRKKNTIIDPDFSIDLDEEEDKEDIRPVSSSIQKSNKKLLRRLDT